MILKELTESNELLIMRSLNTRMELAEKERNHYLSLESGYEGEMKFDQMAMNIPEERYIINDLFLEFNHSFFQIDKLIISQGMIHLLDIKNHFGNWCIESDQFFSLTSKREYKNPIIQLKRCLSLLNQLLQSHKLNYLVEASIIFINPEFTLYQAPIDQPFIFPTQVNRFLNDFNKTTSKLNDGHKKLAQTLLSLHQTKNPFSNLPSYKYESIRKGLVCSKCQSLSVLVENKKCVCTKCGCQEPTSSAIIRSTKEYKLLFPEKQITAEAIYDWCNGAINKRSIGYCLGKNFKRHGVHQWAYYE